MSASVLRNSGERSMGLGFYRALLLVGISSLIAGCSSSGPKSSEYAPSKKRGAESWVYAADEIVIDQAIMSRLQPGIEARLQAGLGWGYTAAVFEKERVEVLAAGRKSVEPSQALATNDVLELGSISKVFTGALLHLAQIEGRLDLNQGLDSIFPELKGTDAGKITPFDLGLHQAGLPSWPEGISQDTSNPWKSLKRSDVLSALARYSRAPLPMDEVRYPRRYSNWGFLVLGLVVEKVYQQPYERVLRSRVLAPLAMTSSGVDLRSAKKPRAIPGLALDSEKSPLWEFGGAAAALGGIEANSVDLGKFLSALVNPPAGKLGMALAAGMDSGIGWDSEPGHLLVWKNGATGGHSGILILDRSRRRGLYLGSNSSVRTDALAAYAMSLTPRDLLLDGAKPERKPTEAEILRLKGHYTAASSVGGPTIRSLRIFETLGRLVGRVLIELDGKTASASVVFLPGEKPGEWLSLDGLSADHDVILLNEGGLSYSAHSPNASSGRIIFNMKKLPEEKESYPATE
jgi:D-alanyl-D-alanine-carboxypeptidase/D-alanyl-D-alanine-endopeptidase